MVRKTEVDLFHSSSFNIFPYLIYTELISSLLDPKLVDPGSTLVHTWGATRLSAVPAVVKPFTFHFNETLSQIGSLRTFRTSLKS